MALNRADKTTAAKERTQLLNKDPIQYSLGNAPADMIQSLLAFCDLVSIKSLSQVNRHLNAQINKQSHLITYYLKGLKGRDFGFEDKDGDIYVKGTYSQLKNFLKSENLTKLRKLNEKVEYIAGPNGIETVYANPKTRANADILAYACGADIIAITILLYVRANIRQFCPEVMNSLSGQIINNGLYITSASCCILTLICCNALDNVMKDSKNIKVIRGELCENFSLFKHKNREGNLLDLSYSPPKISMSDD